MGDNLLPQKFNSRCFLGNHLYLEGQGFKVGFPQKENKANNKLGKAGMTFITKGREHGSVHEMDGQEKSGHSYELAIYKRRGTSGQKAGEKVQPQQ